MEAIIVKLPLEMIYVAFKFLCSILFILVVIDLIIYIRSKGKEENKMTFDFFINILRMFFYVYYIYILITSIRLNQPDYSKFSNYILVSADYAAMLPVLVIEGTVAFRCVLRGLLKPFVVNKKTFI